MKRKPNEKQNEEITINRIREAIEKYNAKLLILDPLSSYIGENCSMNNANETRAEFNHLIAIRVVPLSLSPI